MDYEKLHKDTINKLQQMVNSGKITVETARDICADFVPESGDERIRKLLVEAVIQVLQDQYCSNRGVSKEKVIAWLEKQGEQQDTNMQINPSEYINDMEIMDVDKVEHLSAKKGVYYVCIKNYYQADGKATNTKGKIYKSPCDGYINDDKGFGLSWINSCTENYFRPVKKEEWIVCEQNNVIGKPLQYKEFMNDKLIQKNIKSLENKGIVPNFRLFTINNAKNGDVLAVTMYPEGTWIGIFKEQNGCTFSSHCFVSTDGIFKQGTYGHGNGRAIHPATKEQRDLLFQKMKEASYEWDAEKKELKKVRDEEQIKKNLQDNSFRRMFEQKLAWSEEDERVMESILKHYTYMREEWVNWLKFLKERYTWKPSDEQMGVIEAVINNRSFQRRHLDSLYEQLKKLREE